MRKRFSYANVAATFALVLSMSGGALAATHYLVTSTKQISPKVLKALTGRAGGRGKEGPAGREGKEGKEGREGNEGKEGKGGNEGKEGKEGKGGTDGNQGKEGIPGKEGKEGKEGAVGPSEAYEVELDKTVTAPADSEQTLTLKNLPAGTYAIYGKATIEPQTGSSNTNQCMLTAGAESDQSWTPGTSSDDYITVVTELTHTFTATESVTMSCDNREVKWAFVEKLTRIVAVRVGSTHKTSVEAE